MTSKVVSAIDFLISAVLCAQDRGVFSDSVDRKLDKSIEIIENFIKEVENEATNTRRAESIS